MALFVRHPRFRPSLAASALLVAILSCGGGDPATGPVGGPAVVVKVGSDPTGVVAGGTAGTIRVQVVDGNGSPSAGVAVSFAVTAGGGSVSSPSATTGGDGMAAVQWTTGATAGLNTVRATVSGVGSADFSTTTLAGAVASVTKVGTDPTGVVAKANVDSLRVAARDANGNGVSGVAVAFAVTAGGGSVSPAAAVTDASGQAAVRWATGATVGVNTATATATGFPAVTFTTTTVAGAPATVTKVGTDPTGITAGASAGTITVAVKDANDNLVSGAAVTFAVTAGGGSVSAASANTGANGQAAVTWTSGGTVGLNTATATITGLTAVTFSTTTVAGAVASISKVGTDTTGIVAGANVDSLRVCAKDANNNAVGGVAVTFAVTAGGGSVSSTSVTTGAGCRAAVRWTTGTTAGVNTANATVTGLTAVTFSTTTVAGAAASVAKVGADPTGLVAGFYWDSLKVVVKDANNNPKSGVAVTFAVTAGGGVVPTAPVTTGANGQAAVRWTTGAAAGANTVTATVTSLTPVSFSTTTRAGAAASVTKVGTDTTGLTAGVHWDSISVLVKDANNNLVAGTTVTFAVTAGGGVLSGAGVTTGADGRAAVRWRMGTTAGLNTATATVTGLTPVTFSTTTTAGVPAFFAKVGTVATSMVAGAVVDSLSVKVSYSSGLPFPGATVTFAVTGGGGSVSAATRTTGADGQAAVRWTTGVTAGYNTATATVTGLTAIANFTTTTVAGAAASVTKVGSDPTGVVVGANVDSLRVVVKDANNNVVAGVPVAFAVTAGGGSVSASLDTTGSDGRVAVRWTTGSAAGANTATATVTGLTAVTFTVTTSVAGPASVTKVGADPTGIVAGANVDSLRVLVQDANNNPVANVAVAFAVTAGGGTVAASADTTGSDGKAAVRWTTGATVGVNTVTATVTGLTAVTFSTTTVAGAAASVAKVGTDPTGIAAGANVDSLRVIVKDANNNPKSGVAVAFAVTAGGGSVSSASVNTGADGTAAVRLTTGSTAGTNTATATVTGLTAVTFSVTTVPVAGPASQLRFVVQPSTATAGAANSPAITVKVVDAAGTLVTTATNSITLAFAANPNSGTLSGTLTASDSSGVATFSNVVVNRAGTGYTLAASATGLTSDESSTFAVTPGTATALAFTQQPTAVAAGSAIAPAVQVSIRDAQGNTVTSSTANVALAIGTNPGTSTLVGGSAVAAVSGVATFSGVMLNKVGTSYTLTAASTGLTGATSATFNVTPGTAAVLKVTTEPTSVSVGSSFSVAVTVRDTSANTVTGASAPVTLALLNNPSSATLGGTLRVTPTNGVATFSGLTLNAPGTGFTIIATGSGLVSDTTAAVNAIGPVSQLVYTTQPSNAVRNATVSPAIVVEARDAVGNRVTGFYSGVTLAMGTNPGSGTLTGTTSVSAAAGVATFSNVQITAAGTGYTLLAGATGIPNSASATFDISAFGTATKLGFTVQPSGADNGVAISPAVAVAVQDAQGNTVTISTASVTMAIGTNPGSATLGGTTTASAVAGVASFSSLTLSAAGTGYTLSATSSGLTTATSNTFTITVLGAAQRLRFDVQPTNTSPSSFVTPAIVVSAVNSSGAIVTAASGTVTLGIDSGPPNAPALSASASLSNGQATFNSVQFTVAGNYYLRASVAGLTSTVSTVFTVNPGAPAKLAFISQPVNTVAGNVMATTVRVEIQDAAGNRVPTAGNQVRLGQYSYNPPSTYFTGVVLDGDTLHNAQNGVATFTLLRPRASGIYAQNPHDNELQASSTGLTGAYSASYDVFPAPAKRLIANSPGASRIGRTAGNQLSVVPVDSIGNWAARGGEVVTLSMLNNPSGGHLTGIVAVAATAYSYTYLSPVIDSLGSNYTLLATSSGLIPDTTAAFSVVASTAAQLGFVVQPANTAANTALTPAVRVCVTDAYANEVRTATGTVAMVISTNAGGSTLGGTTTRTFASGCAAFSDLQLNAAGTGYQLGATPSGVSGVTGLFTSLPFNITP